ncbi:hypothetical protein Hanom_Chr09g00842321 [Helianthus anomalus]
MFSYSSCLKTCAFLDYYYCYYYLLVLPMVVASVDDLDQKKHQKPLNHLYLHLHPSLLHPSSYHHHHQCHHDDDHHHP